MTEFTYRRIPNHVSLPENSRQLANEEQIKAGDKRFDKADPKKIWTTVREDWRLVSESHKDFIYARPITQAS
jgi:hypothetical protein